MGATVFVMPKLRTDSKMDIFRFGASYIDPLSGIKVALYHPQIFLEEWESYLSGLTASYQSHGVEGVLENKRLREAQGVSMFALAYTRDGRVVGGMRFHGPLTEVDSVAVTNEMCGSEDYDEIRSVLGEHIAQGVIEIKGMWSLGEAVIGQKIATVIMRAHVIGARVFGARFVYATISGRIASHAYCVGAQKIYEGPAFYPSEEYQTHAFFIDDHLVEENAIRWANEAGEGEPGYARILDQVEKSSRGIAQDGRHLSVAKALILERDDPFIQHLFDSGARVVDRYERDSVGLKEGLGFGDHLSMENWRWAYYAWSDTLIKIAGPQEMSALRLDRNRNKITKDEQARLRALHIGVVGASAGHVIAYALAQEGLAGMIRIADFDEIELGNLNRLPAGIADLGTNKAIFFARRVSELDPYMRVEPWSSGVCEENLDRFLSGLDLVVEECDSLNMKLLVREHARRLQIPVLMETSDRGTLDVERFDLEPERPIFHGLIEGVSAKELAGLSVSDRGPYVIRLIGAETMGPKLAASLFEVDHTMGGWPQLSGDLALGAASVAAAVVRIGLGRPLYSGRVRIDLDETLSNMNPVMPAANILASLNAPAPTDLDAEYEDPILDIVDAARRAPSGGNVQPWKFVGNTSSLEVFVETSRSHSAMDVKWRGSFVAAGAALLNARVRAAHLGKLGQVEIMPNGPRGILAGRITLGNARDRELAQLNPFILTRVTNRKRPEHKMWDNALTSVLNEAVSSEGAKLYLIEDSSSIKWVAGALGRSDQLRYLISAVHREMMGELSWPGRHDLRVGLDVRSLELSPSDLAAFALVARGDVMGELAAWRAGDELAKHTVEVVEGSSALAVISIPRGGYRSYVSGGQALERFWLKATSLGISVQPAAPVYLYADSEEDLIQLGGERYLDELYQRKTEFREHFLMGDDEVLVMVLRLFYAGAPTVKSVRLGVEDVFTRDSPS